MEAAGEQETVKLNFIIVFEYIRIFPVFRNGTFFVQFCGNIFHLGLSSRSQIAAVIGFRIDIEKRRGRRDTVRAKVPQCVRERVWRRPPDVPERDDALRSAAEARKPIAAILRAPKNRIGAVKLSECLRDYLACYEWNVGPDDDQRTPAAAVENALHALSYIPSPLAHALAFPSGNRRRGQRIGAYPGSFGTMSHVATSCDPGCGPSGRSEMTKCEAPSRERRMTGVVRRYRQDCAKPPGSGNLPEQRGSQCPRQGRGGHRPDSLGKPRIDRAADRGLRHDDEKRRLMHLERPLTWPSHSVQRGAPAERPCSSSSGKTDC